MKRANPFTANKAAAGLSDMLPALSIRVAGPAKPIRLKAVHYPVLLVMIMCFLLPGYLGNVNWNDCATGLNDRCVAIPVFMDSAVSACERQATKLFIRMLRCSSREITAKKNRYGKRYK